MPTSQTHMKTTMVSLAQPVRSVRTDDEPYNYEGSPNPKRLYRSGKRQGPMACVCAAGSLNGLAGNLPWSGSATALSVPLFAGPLADYRIHGDVDHRPEAAHALRET